MIIGLDVGGTHTDAVLIEHGKVIASHKTSTDHDNLLNSINRTLQEVTKNIDKTAIQGINLSTTLSTNAIVEDKIEDVGLIYSAGPGIVPENYEIGKYCYRIKGAIDHRGSVVKNVDEYEIKNLWDEVQYSGISVFSVVSKFSTRNPLHENVIGNFFKGIGDFITHGHHLSGELNFPRRMATAYYNSAVWRIYNEFTDAIKKSLAELGIHCRINILKADGGTIPLELSQKIPVESILSGPAASVMGIVALCKISDDSILLDVGGTTTDIAVFTNGLPLVERKGISIGGHPTLVRSLETRSIGIGGDSLITVNEKIVRVGPERKGPCMAEGGLEPTFVDALNYKGLSHFGKKEQSIRGIEELAKQKGIKVKKLVDDSINFAVKKISAEVDSLINDLNNKPVYTIHEMIDGKVITPTLMYIMGGPAQGLKKVLQDEMGLEAIVPANFEVANAIGAACAKTTFDIELFADTGKGILLVPNLNITEQVDDTYSLNDAQKDAKKYLSQYLNDNGIAVTVEDAEIVESSAFKMVDGFMGSGKDIRVKCQIKPGVEMSITGGSQ
ncbi:MAG: hydantoinase/oxoprolinase family protein [Bacteroidales bacterium]|jgi:N-methylhydantoinase A/oxoprolinase/acetone carboxylase beta subunit|nr:hydantoinase/oxoprolinase family protein [Bacteroidales bacterium]